eukprot:TRINITY_DN5246_c0_g1_i6.p1 TRINITY_DN5246_c0_g1~~TRINITY_DN5246_c0_g1_i6.p1  ORF type:complete len:555 (-),score=72.93 TRINITY_DN5246_c0_g1_i6:237-1901(-)
MKSWGLNYRNSYYKYVFFAVVPSLLTLICSASQTIQVYRLLQYDQDGKQFGSRTAALNHYVTLAVEGSQVLGSVVLLPMWQLTDDKVKELLSGAFRLAGLVIVLPGNDQKQQLLDREFAHNAWKAEKWLMDQTFQIPVYFTLNNTDINQMVDKLQLQIQSGIPPSAVNGGFRAIVSAKKPTPIKAEGFANVLGWLHGTEIGSGDVFRGHPTIAIVANYDTWGSAPGLAYGADVNGSGVVVLIQLMKFFSKLYSREESRPHYNLLFMVTSGGPWNFEGALHWLNKRADPSLLETIELVVCLDELGKWKDGGQVSMIYSKPPKDENVKQIYDKFSDAAHAFDIPLAQVHKKINLSAESVAYQHEHFSQKRILSITISGHTDIPFPSVFDRKSTIDIDAMYESAQLIGEAIADLIFVEKPEYFFTLGADSSLDPDKNFLDQMLDMLSMTSRCAPVNVPLREGLIPALKGLFEKWTKGVRVDAFGMGVGIRVYDAQIMELRVVRMAGVLFDVFLLFGVVLMLLALFAGVRVYLFGYEELRRDVRTFLQPQTKKGGKRR